MQFLDLHKWRFLWFLRVYRDAPIVAVRVARGCTLVFPAVFCPEGFGRMGLKISLILGSLIGRCNGVPLWTCGKQYGSSGPLRGTVRSAGNPGFLLTRPLTGRSPSDLWRQPDRSVLKTGIGRSFNRGCSDLRICHHLRYNFFPYNGNILSHIFLHILFCAFWKTIRKRVSLVLLN